MISIGRELYIESVETRRLLRDTEHANHPAVQWMNVRRAAAALALLA
jgi:hypothetical protein